MKKPRESGARQRVPMQPTWLSVDQLLLAQVLNAEGQLAGGTACFFGLACHLLGGGDGHGSASGDDLGMGSQVGGWRVASGDEPDTVLLLIPPDERSSRPVNDLEIVAVVTE